MVWVIVILLGLVVVFQWQIWSVLDKTYVTQLRIDQFLEQHIVPRTADLVNLAKKQKEWNE